MIALPYCVSPRHFDHEPPLAVDQTLLCDPCTRRLYGWLRDIPADYLALTLLLEPPLLQRIEHGDGTAHQAVMTEPDLNAIQLTSWIGNATADRRGRASAGGVPFVVPEDDGSYVPPVLSTLHSVAEALREELDPSRLTEPAGVEPARPARMVATGIAQSRREQTVAVIRCDQSDLPVTACVDCRSGFHSGGYESAPWVTTIIETNTGSTTPRTTVPLELTTVVGEVNYLLTALHHLVRAEWVADAYGRIEQASTGLRRAHPPLPKPKLLGNHRDEKNYPPGAVGGYCWGQVFDPVGTAPAFCDGCGRVWPGSQAIARMTLEVV
ncbi:hypothetical protein SAMN05892883_2086 [Jatrophihabitans sp. GAS493]|uniref:hypothetical protein n=1 Tax=Jatrophihabitans sp. GAS493 TaxID=1907575 RepID=UPI000BB6E066|nr:hypothetical protein [Jatrophihabitans sp. GAS493]SOD72739.1 hypothetical protein SAMN05892883_2086 [Jatrophihabitans sp. GAS493]